MAGLKILYINFEVTPQVQIGGMTAHAIGVIEAFANIGNELTVCSYSKIQNLQKKNISYYLLDTGKPTRSHSKPVALIHELSRQRRSVRQILQLLDTESFDIIYARWSRNIFFNKIHVQHPEIPIVLECSTPLELTGVIYNRNRILRRLYHLIDKKNLQSASIVSTVSHEVKEFLQKHHPEFNREKIIVIPNGVDPTRFQNRENSIRTKYNIPSSSTVVGFAGSMYPWQGAEVLIEAFQTIAQKNMHLLIIGSCIDAKVNARINQLLAAGESSRIILTGSVDYGEMPKYLSACDILISPTVESANGHFHGSPTKVFEYMAMKKGIVASNIGQIGTVLQHNYNALLTEPRNINQLKEGILRLADDKDLRVRLGKQARKDAVTQYSWHKNVETVLHALQDELPT